MTSRLVTGISKSLFYSVRNMGGYGREMGGQVRETGGKVREIDGWLS